MGAEQSTEGAPAAEAPAAAEVPDVSDSVPAAKAVVDGPTPGLPSAGEIEGMAAGDVLKTFGVVASGRNFKDTPVATACCKRLRVLCRESDGRKQCEELDAARVMIDAIDALTPLDATLALQSLAALVNICAEREVDSLRDAAVNAGALRVAVRAINDHHKENMQVTEMACLLVRNLCCGKDENVLERRKQAASVGVIEATVTAMAKYEESPIAPNIIVALRLVVDRLPDQRQRATALGAKTDWVKPVTKEGGGYLLSFRGGFGTNRSSKPKTPPKIMQASTLGGIQEESGAPEA
jgi:hypothetical protein